MRKSVETCQGELQELVPVNLEVMGLDDGLVHLFGDQLEPRLPMKRRVGVADEAPSARPGGDHALVFQFRVGLGDVLRFTLSSSASGRIEGRVSPGLAAPEATAAFTWSTTCRYTGLLDLKLSSNRI